MDGENFLAKLSGLQRQIEPLEILLEKVNNTLTPPLFYHSGKEHFGFRYAKPDIRHFCLLKGVRIVSALNASIALAREGYLQEFFVLMRSLYEYMTHIEFVLYSCKTDVSSKEKSEQYITEYFQDFARNDAADFGKIRLRQSEVHDGIAKALDEWRSEKETARKVKTIDALWRVYGEFSNYVHARYPEVMDLYGGKPGHFHLRGMLNTPKAVEPIIFLTTAVESASLTFRLMIATFRLFELVHSDEKLHKWYLQATDSE